MDSVIRVQSLYDAVYFAYCANGLLGKVNIQLFGWSSGTDKFLAIDEKESSEFKTVKLR